VPLETIPNFQIARVGLRHKLNVMFPRMHTRTSRLMMQTDISLFYEDALRPSFLEVFPERTAEFPVNYRAAVLQARTAGGTLSSHEVEIPQTLVQEFFASLRRHANRSIPEFHDIYFVHTIRGVKNSTIHNPESSDDRIRAMAVLLGDFDFGQLNHDQWWVDVGMELSAPGKSVQWLRHSHRGILEWLFPNITEGQLHNIFEKEERYWCDRVATCDDLAGFRAIPQLSLSAGRAIHYIQAYPTEKSGTYQLHRGVWRKRSPKCIFPRAMVKLVADISEFPSVFIDNNLILVAPSEIMLEILHICAENQPIPESLSQRSNEPSATEEDEDGDDSDGTSDSDRHTDEGDSEENDEVESARYRPGQEGAARIECRTTLDNALSDFMTYIPSWLVKEGLKFLDASTLW